MFNEFSAFRKPDIITTPLTAYHASLLWVSSIWFTM